MKKLKIHNFEQFNEKLNNPEKIVLDDYVILDLISSNKGKVRKILKLISKMLIDEYLVIYYQDSEDVIDKLKELGFGVKIYDDSNEYSENFDDKVEISWICDFKNTNLDGIAYDE